MRWGKRGIAPVISTLLLIMFASALGVIVMSWGRTTTIKANIPDCSQTSLNIISYNDQAQVCYRDNQLFFTLENNGITDIAGVKVIILSTFNIVQEDVNERMDVADIIRSQVKFNNQGEIQKVKFVPKIYVENELQLCPNNGLEVENIKEC